MIITFIGHSQIVGQAEARQRLIETILACVKDENDLQFFCGGYGDFDNLGRSVSMALKTQYPNSKVVFVTPYMTLDYQRNIQEYLNLKLYDEIVYPPLENVFPRYAISRRNEWMIDQSDYVIAYVQQTYGGAYQSLQYARRKKKRILNLAEK